MAGFHWIAERAALKRTRRTPGRPWPVRARACCLPLFRVCGASPTKAAISLPSSWPSSGSSASRVWTVTGPTHLKLRSKAAVASELGMGRDMPCDGLLDGIERAPQGGDDLLQGVLDDRIVGQGGAAALGVQCVRELAPPDRERPQGRITFDERGQTPLCQFERGKLGEERGVDRIGLGLAAAASTEGGDLVGVNANEPDAALAKCLAQQPFVTAGRLKGDQADRGGIERAEPGSDCGRRVGDPPAARASVAGDVEPFLGNVDPEEELVLHVPPRHTMRLVCTPDCIRAKAPTPVRVRDRDAGRFEMPTVVRPIHESSACRRRHPASGRTTRTCNPRATATISPSGSWMAGPSPAKTMMGVNPLGRIGL